MPTTHEIILFRDKHGAEHYGVLCGDLAKDSHKNKFWCHLFQKTYAKKDVTYWCEIPINKYFIREREDFSARINKFLWSSFNDIEREILDESKEHQKDCPHFTSEQLVQIAARNCLHRMMQLVRASTP